MGITMNLNARRWALLLFVFGLAATGCGNLKNLGKPAPRFAQFDLGVPDPVNPPLASVPASFEVRTPSWLSNAAMQYRLDYRQPAQRELYSESRWVSPPGEMLELALNRAIAGDAVASNDCRLLIEVDEFVQVFESAASSRSETVVRAALMPPRADVALARRTFMVREPAPTPDAEGGVIAHRLGTRRLAAEIASWLTSLDPAESAGPNRRGMCRR